MAPASLFRSRTAAAAAALGLLLGCGGGGHSSASSTSDTPASVHGKVTYVRAPMLMDGSGVPTGLDPDPSHAVTLPARDLLVRIFQYKTVGTAPNTAQHWVRVAETHTGSDGTYTLPVTAGDNYLVELDSTLGYGNGPAVRLVSDPLGLSSTAPWYQRPQYFLRASLAGQSATPSDLEPQSSATANGNYTVDFQVDATTAWLVGSTQAGANGEPTDFTGCAFESTPSGARILSILDAISDVSTTYPNSALKAPVDLHYAAGVSDPGGSYIEYNTKRWVQSGGFDPAFDADSAVEHYFGTLQGGSGADDGWNLSAIYQMFSRYALFTQGSTYPFGPASSRLRPVNTPADGLSPDIAVQEGLSSAMAANLLKSPYLYALDGSGAVTSTTDIRDISSVPVAAQGPYSARTLAALGWEILLKANSQVSPSNPTAWATINPTASARFFILPAATVGVYEPPTIYNQLARLQEAKTASEPVDLAALFTDATISGISSPFNLPWPKPSTTLFGSSWTASASTQTFSDTLTMADDVMVGGAYANESAGEVRYLGLDQVADQTYQLSVSMSPSSLSNGAIQVQVLTIDGPLTYTFQASSTQPSSLFLHGSGNSASPLRYPVLVRLISPTTLQPDVTFTLTLTAVAPSLKSHGSPALR